MSVLLALAAALPMLGLVPPQPLPEGQCAMALWDRASGERVALVTREALVLVLDGALLRLAPVAAQAGFVAEADYAAGGVSARHQLVLETGADGRAGRVEDGVLVVWRGDGTELVTPVAGLIGCG
jgi:hypothetical protein